MIPPDSAGTNAAAHAVRLSLFALYRVDCRWSLRTALVLANDRHPLAFARVRRLAGVHFPASESRNRAPQTYSAGSKKTAILEYVIPSISAHPNFLRALK